MRARVRWMRAAVVGVAVIGVVCAWSVVHAQGTIAGQAMMAKGVDPDWEAATVRPSDPDERESIFVVIGRHVTIKNRTMENLLLIGYGVQKSQIADAPKWVRTEHFDVDGVPDAEGQPNPVQMQSLMRKLLKERFGLKLHMEQRAMPVYALTVAKGGEKMAASKGDPNGLPDENEQQNGGEQTMRMTNVAVEDLAMNLNVSLDRPVVDQTGLNGRYDFQLRYVADELRAPTDGSALPSLFTAVQEQLGLKLEAVKAMAPMLVIEKVERPGAN